MILNELFESLRTENPFQQGYHPVGTKKKNGRTVPNCVPNATEGVAEGSLNEFAPDGFNGGDDGDEFSPEIAKMAQEDGFTKGVSLADGATLERAMAINYWHSQHGGMYKQYFAKGFKAGRMEKIRHDNKQYNLNLKLMKDGSIRHGEQGVAEGKANLEKALDTLRGSWSGWIKDKTTDPNIESYWFDDGEGGHDASGSIQHDLRTGRITVDYEDEYGETVKGTFDSVGAAMNALRGGYPGSHGSGKAPNFDTLAGREFSASDDLYKTDRAGKKGTLTKTRMDTMKASSPYRMRGGPKGPLPEGVAEGSLNEGQYEMMMRNGQVKKFVAKDDADAKRIAAGHGAKSVIRLRGGVPAGKVAEQGVAEGADRSDMVGFHLDSERAYNAVMSRFGDMIDHDEDSGIMYAPERIWPKIELVAYDADGIGAQRDDELENPEHYGVDEGEKVGHMDADQFDAAMARLKQLAGAGPLKTVWDPQKRVYRNVPTAQQPSKK